MLSIKGNTSSLLKDKKITICVSGSVAAVRVPELARELIRHGADVKIVASEAALELVGEPLLEWASENEIVTQLTGKIEHVEYGAYADVVLVCPATANTISKIAKGIDDTPVTSTVTCAIGAEKPVIVVPAMHESMYKHPIVTENIGLLERVGIKFVLPTIVENKAKLASNEEIIELVIGEVAEKDLAGKRVVVTGGPTYEAIDAVRGITNLSSGRMGIELAKQAYRRGADVVLVYGPGDLEPPSWIKTAKAISAQQMNDLVKSALKEADVLISAAAIADYKPVITFREKLSSKTKRTLELEPTPKIVREARTNYPNKIIIGFKLENEDSIERAYGKLLSDGLDLIVANGIEAIGSKTNDVHLIDRNKRITSFSGTKSQIAGFILDAALGLIEAREEAKA